jgi:hypothetical protein
MKRWILLPVLALAALALAVSAVAKNPKKQPHPNKVTVLIHTTDNGCAGNPWADDTIQRTLKVHQNADGSYRIKEEDKGVFVTNAGGAVASPGNCPENKSRHGHTVRPGVTGTLKGYIKGTVTGGTFNPTATCSATPCTQAMFIAAFFGPTATFSCRTNSTDCKFDYKYHAKENQRLLFRSWRDSGTGAGSMLNERFRGDIADA